VKSACYLDWRSARIKGLSRLVFPSLAVGKRRAASDTLFGMVRVHAARKTDFRAAIFGLSISRSTKLVALPVDLVSRFEAAHDPDDVSGT
jgi:hypothetical protein